ncbi:MAG TPA: hypothetical protein VKG84_03995 [Candidatus Acidoferrales bacterium]|nr:hypothetical protein [Candidatus Acidoferrales bacterium]
MLGRAAQRACGAAGAALLLALVATPLCAWGPNAHRLEVNKAIDTLPPDLRSWFEANRPYLSQHVTDPLNALAKNAAEIRFQRIELEKYGRFPYEALPRDYKAALKKFTKPALDANGLLPWQIGLYSERLTNDMKVGDWNAARSDAALLAFYVGEAHDPFSTTDNFDGHLSGQTGVDVRFDSNLVDRFALFIYVRPNDAFFIPDPTDRAFEDCLTSHSWIQAILLADRRARGDLPDYTDDYYDHFYNSAGAIVIRQLSEASTEIGSYWLTAWTNAGKPQPPPR